VLISLFSINNLIHQLTRTRSIDIESTTGQLKLLWWETILPIKSHWQERERYRDPVRECLKGLLAIGWTVEHSEVEVPLNHRGSTRRQSKPQIVC